VNSGVKSPAHKEPLGKKRPLRPMYGVRMKKKMTREDPGGEQKKKKSLCSRFGSPLPRASRSLEGGKVSNGIQEKKRPGGGTDKSKKGGHGGAARKGKIIPGQSAMRVSGGKKKTLDPEKGIGGK